MQKQNPNQFSDVFFPSLVSAAGILLYTVGSLDLILSNVQTDATTHVGSCYLREAKNLTGFKLYSLFLLVFLWYNILSQCEKYMYIIF